MPLDIRPEGRFNSVPAGSTLKVKVTTTSTHINVTGRMDLSGGGTQQWPHGSIVNKTKTVTLTKPGLQQVRVSSVISNTTQQQADVSFVVENPDGTKIRSFEQGFKGAMKGKDPYIGRIKLIIKIA